VSGTTTEHVPVLTDSLAEQINLPPDGVMVDATIGQGGHSYLFGKFLGPSGVIIGLDVHEKAIQAARNRLRELKCRPILIQANFARIAHEVHKQGIQEVDLILADLGISSAQLADAEIGLSFQADMPLDMRIDKRLTTTAADIVNRVDEKSLADLIYRYGEEKASRRIARRIVWQRQRETITTTKQLATLICKAVKRPGRGRKPKIHPATKTFQALRIAVNSELENLKEMLATAPALLKKGGSIAVISYHSLEDRMVKTNFKQNEKQSIYRIVSKKPIVPTREEITRNRRARSAKLRIAERQ
jgi:16S rRNA (cytosine1402-N4)-methyltransferase